MLACVALGLVMRDLWQIRGWAVQARDIERSLRVQSAREIEDLEDRHLERIRDLGAEIAGLRANGFRPPPAPRPADVDAVAVELPAEP